MLEPGERRGSGRQKLVLASMGAALTCSDLAERIEGTGG